MEILNELPEKKRREIDDFLTFIGIYEDKTRERALKKLLYQNRNLIKDKICVEAGAGLGIFSIYMAELGAKKVYAVEESKIMFEFLRENVKNYRNIIPVNEKIEKFKPEEKVDFLFHEFYGSMLFDESIYSLYRLKFKPRHIVPDGGRLWCMFLNEKDILKKDKIYTHKWRRIFKNVLILDLFPWVKFKNHKKIIDWNIKEKPEREFVVEVNRKADFLVFASEITHKGKSILKTWKAKNWALVFTPKTGNRFFIKFRYLDGYTKVNFRWI